jgi:hypothetical protein
MYEYEPQKLSIDGMGMKQYLEKLHYISVYHF